MNINVHSKLLNDGHLDVGSHAHWSIFTFIQFVLVQELDVKIFSYVINSLRR